MNPKYRLDVLKYSETHLFDSLVIVIAIFLRQFCPRGEEDLCDEVNPV